MITHPVDQPNVQHTPTTDTRAADVLALVNQILSRLDAANIAYCVLRNRDRIPSGMLEWDDLDLMVDRRVPIRDLLQLFSDLNPTQVAPVRAGFTPIFFPAGDLSLRVDLYHGDMEWRAAAYGINQVILAERHDDNGVMVASGMHQAFLAWFSRLLREGSFKDRYAPMIMEAMRQRPDDFRALLEETFGKRMAAHLIDLARSGRLKESDAIVGELKRLLWLHSLRRQPFGTVTRYLRQIGNAIDHRLRPAGLDVALLGPDGAGKSSLCAAIAAQPSRRVPFTKVKYRRLYHRVLPTIGDLEAKIRRRPRRARPDASDPHGVSPRPTLMWIAFQAYYTVDHWLSELIWNRRQLAHTNLVLHDRHPIEVVIDPTRYRFAGPLWIARLFGRLAPQPDLLIILDAPPEVFQARKQEITYEETARQRAAFQDLASRMPNARIVDASQPFASVVDDVMTEINAFTEKKSRRRFGALTARPGSRKTPDPLLQTKQHIREQS